MRKTLVLILIVLASAQAKAQFIKEKSVDVSIGLGYSFPNNNYNVTGSGFYLQGEYVLTVTKWFDIRPYVGLILTKSSTSDDQINTAYKSIANAALIGGKTRINAPIPWIAPYLEIGVGVSIGSFETFTPFTNIDKSGLIFHIPFSIGLELGPKHNFDISLSYYFHPSVEQIVGAAAFGVSFPLGKNG